MSEAMKHDNGKVDLSLVPEPAVIGIARALMFGTTKYPRNNYRKGFNVSRMVAALLRHLYRWNEGEDVDPESGLPHIYHVGACYAILVTNLMEGTAIDDRYKGAPDEGAGDFRQPASPEGTWFAGKISSGD